MIFVCNDLLTGIRWPLINYFNWGICFTFNEYSVDFFIVNVFLSFWGLGIFGGDCGVPSTMSLLALSTELSNGVGC